MKITLLTNGYPPNVYGGAGVHVDHLSREIERLDEGKHRPPDAGILQRLGSSGLISHRAELCSTISA
jgi:hypothetical protein